MDGYTSAADKAAQDRFYVTTGGKERQVGKREFVSIQNSAGFKSKFGPDEVAASTFSSGRGESAVSGRVEHARNMSAVRSISKGPTDSADTEQGPMPRSSDFSR